MQSRKLVASTLGKNFHAAIVVIAHPTGNAKDMRLALDKPAEAHALHASTHQEAAGLDRLFSGRHFREIAEVRSQKLNLRGSNILHFDF